MAVAAAAIARFTSRPALWYALWLVVLLRLLVPPLFELPLPELGSSAPETGTTLVAVSGGAVAIDDPTVALDPTAVRALRCGSSP